MKKAFREPVNTITHMIGAILAVIGIMVMFGIIINQHELEPRFVVSVLAFGLGLMALYSASSYYHGISPDNKNRLLRMKRTDHAMIFVLIAGSYTPFCLLGTAGYALTGLLAAVWIVAAIGVLLMIFWIGMPRWLNTVLYIGLGWFAVFGLKTLFQTLPLPAFVLLFVGGVLYTIGGIMYGLKKPNLSPLFGHHEIFHLFVLAGSMCHYIAVAVFLL